MSRSPVYSQLEARSDRLLAWCLGLGLLLLGLAQLPSFFWQGYVVPKLIVITALVPLLLILLAASQLGRRRGSFQVDWYLLAGLGFILWSGLTVLTSTNPGLSILGGVFRYEGLLGFVAYFVVFLAARYIASLRFMPGRVGVLLGATCAGLIGLLAMLQHVWPAGNPIDALSLSWAARSPSTFTNPIMLGLFASLAIPVLLALLLAIPQGYEQPLLVASTSLIAAGAFLSYSRSFWLAAPMGCALAIILARPYGISHWRSLIPVVAFTGLCLLVSLQAANMGSGDGPAGTPGASSVSVSSRVGETISGGGSVRSRLELYRSTVALIAEKPLQGRGFETYLVEAARTRSQALVQLESHKAYADRPHNSLLYIGYSVGLPGLVLYLLFLGGAFTSAIRGYRKRHGIERVLAGGLLGALVAYFLAEQTVFSTIEVTPLFFAALGWAVAPALLTVDQDRETTAVTHWQRRVTIPGRYAVALPLLAAISSIAWLWVAGPRVVNVLSADHLHYEVLTQTEGSSRWQDSVEDELKAARRDPYTPYYWNTAALILASAAEQRGQPTELERARQTLQEGLTYLPNDPTLVVSLSDVLYRGEKPREVIALLVPYLKRDRYQADAHYNLGITYLALKKPQEALPHLIAAATHNPRDADSHWYLGEAYLALGRDDEARAAQETAASLDPEYASAPRD